MEAITLLPRHDLSTSASRAVTPSEQAKTAVLLITPCNDSDSAISNIGGEVQDRVTLPRKFREWPDLLAPLIKEVSEIVYNDISLVDTGRVGGLSDAEENILTYLFPETLNVRLVGHLLVIRVETLPPKPWPIAVAGMPVCLTTMPYDRGIDIGERGFGTQILEDLKDKIDSNLADVASAIYNHFSFELGVRLVRSVWLGGAFSIVTPRPVGFGDLPRKIAGFPAFYVVQSPARLRQEAAFPMFNSSGGTVRDDSFYGDILCPGVMLSNRGPPEYLSSSGIPVVNENGDKFITVSTRGFQGSMDIYHSRGKTAESIGSIEATLPYTDIGLVELDHGISYTAVPFDHHDERPDKNQLLRTSPSIVIALAKDTPILSEVYINTPFTGHTKGILFARVVEYDVSLHQQICCVPQAWIWFGNGCRSFWNGASGAPVMKGNNVVGLFSYFDVELGVGCAVEADILLSRGYHISEIGFGGLLGRERSEGVHARRLVVDPPPFIRPDIIVPDRPRVGIPRSLALALWWARQ